jgi:hypothetical protein
VLLRIDAFAHRQQLRDNVVVYEEHCVSSRIGIVAAFASTDSASMLLIAVSRGSTFAPRKGSARYDRTGLRFKADPARDGLGKHGKSRLFGPARTHRRLGTEWPLSA